LRTLVRAVRLVGEADPARAAAYALTTIVGGALPVATAWLAKLMLDGVVAALGAPGDALVARTAFALAMGYAAARLVGHLLDPLEQQLRGTLDARVTGHVEQRMMVAGGAIPDLDHFERKTFLDEIALLRGEISWRPRVLMGELHSLAQSAVALGGSLTLLSALQPLLALGLALGALPQVVAEGRAQRRTYQSIVDRSGVAREMAYCAAVATEPAAAKEVLVFGSGPWWYRRWQRLAQEALREASRLRRARLGGALVVVAVNGLLLAGGYAYVAAQVGMGRLTIGDFALYLSLLAGLQATLGRLVWSGTHAYGTVAFMRRLFAFLDETRPSIVLPPAGAGLPVPARLRQGLALRHVAFAYPERPAAVLEDVTCTLGAGETVALVGENGAGKTTLVKLLTRLYDPTGGELLLDGVPLDRYDLAALRQRIAVVFQDFARFALSAQHNVGVGDAPHADDRARVLTAARWSGAEAVMARLPRGLETLLSPLFEGGVDLSGGEWQKVATARAAMRDAALVILDEPTAALDAQAEHDLFGRFRELAAGRTVLLISHRFSTVRMADRIIVLDCGRVREAGSHAELMAAGGLYAELYALQARAYRD